MRITSDPPKRRRDLDKHGLSLQGVTPAFFETAKVEPAKDGRFKPLGSEAFHRSARDQPASRTG